MNFLKWNSFRGSKKLKRLIQVTSAGVLSLMVMGVQACHSGNNAPSGRSDNALSLGVSDQSVTFKRDLSGKYTSQTGQSPWVLDISACPKTGCQGIEQPNGLLFQPLEDTSYRYGWNPIMENIPLNKSVTYEFSMWLPENAGADANDPSVLTVGMWVNQQGYSVLSQRFSQDKAWVEFVSTGAGATHSGGNVTRLSSGYPRGYPVREEWNQIRLTVVWSDNSSKGKMQWSYNDKPLMNYQGKTLADSVTIPPVFLLGSMVEGNEAFVQKTSAAGIKFRDVRITVEK